jgi:hypothetical protein
MSEKALRKNVKNILNRGHVIQLESHATANGTPDTNVCLDGREHWIELKHGTKKKPWKLRPSQKTWFTRRARVGGRNLWLLWQYDDGNKTVYGIIHMVGERIDAVFRDTSPSFWSYASVITWVDQIDRERLNTLLGDKK